MLTDTHTHGRRSPSLILPRGTEARTCGVVSRARMLCREGAVCPTVSEAGLGRRTRRGRRSRGVGREHIGSRMAWGAWSAWRTWKQVRIQPSEGHFQPWVWLHCWVLCNGLGGCWKKVPWRVSTWARAWSQGVLGDVGFGCPLPNCSGMMSGAGRRALPSPSWNACGPSPRSQTSMECEMEVYLWPGTQ
jgi:hypothetical protein